MLDMSGRPLRPLGDGQDSVLDRALRQVVRSLDDPNGVISAFQSFIGE
jgi:FXSXX-COOH protein